MFGEGWRDGENGGVIDVESGEWFCCLNCWQMTRALMAHGFIEQGAAPIADHATARTNGRRRQTRPRGRAGGRPSGRRRPE